MVIGNELLRNLIKDFYLKWDMKSSYTSIVAVLLDFKKLTHDFVKDVIDAVLVNPPEPE